MKVLWITNASLPEASNLLNGNKYESNSTGSWVFALAYSLLALHSSEIKLIIASPHKGVTKLTKLSGEKIDYYLLPVFGSTEYYHPEYENIWKRINKVENPDIIHIHGTEYPHGLAYVNSCGNRNVVVSIQGLISEISQEYLGGIHKDILKKYTSLRDIVRKDTLFQQQSRIKARALYEIELLSKIKNAIGRTHWDKERSHTINSSLRYFSCNEILRNEFYSGKWTYATCKAHSIYVTQGNYPIKGLHILIKALPKILKMFPDTIVRVSGINIMRGNSLKDRVLRNGYARYLLHLMKEYKVIDKVQFIGCANAMRVKQEMLQCNVFVLPSIIENSPNSLGEAQLLGVPCVASNVGGVSTMIPNKECGLMYSYENVEALAAQIINAFNVSKSFDNTTMRKISANRHNSSVNTTHLLSIYNEIIKNA